MMKPKQINAVRIGWAVMRNKLPCWAREIFDTEADARWTLTQQKNGFLPRGDNFRVVPVYREVEK